ncbi:hypothetical protein NKI63_12695 [Mesorhizobium sp. M0410]|uniref:hypothetical protein n=1 Tax=Mesorhizobium sp. M0410 TaxID=2956943 RepID=UPI0033389E65
MNLGRLPIVDADEGEGFSGDYIATNQNDSQHTICELVCQSTIKAFRHEVGSKRGPSARGERDDEAAE